MAIIWLRASNPTPLLIFPRIRRKVPGEGRCYGRKIKVKSLLSDAQSMEEATADVYGERGVKIRYRVRDLMWRPVGQLVRFVVVVHPTRGKILLMTTDLTLCPLD